MSKQKNKKLVTRVLAAFALTFLSLITPLTIKASTPTSSELQSYYKIQKSDIWTTVCVIFNSGSKDCVTGLSYNSSQNDYIWNNIKLIRGEWWLAASPYYYLYKTLGEPGVQPPLTDLTADKKAAWQVIANMYKNAGSQTAYDYIMSQISPSQSCFPYSYDADTFQYVDPPNADLVTTMQSISSVRYFAGTAYLPRRYMLTDAEIGRMSTNLIGWDAVATLYSEISFAASSCQGYDSEYMDADYSYSAIMNAMFSPDDGGGTTPPDNPPPSVDPGNIAISLSKPTFNKKVDSTQVVTPTYTPPSNYAGKTLVAKFFLGKTGKQTQGEADTDFMQSSQTSFKDTGLNGRTSTFSNVYQLPVGWHQVKLEITDKTVTPNVLVSTVSVYFEITDPPCGTILRSNETYFFCKDNNRLIISDAIRRQTINDSERTKRFVWAPEGSSVALPMSLLDSVLVIGSPTDKTAWTAVRDLYDMIAANPINDADKTAAEAISKQISAKLSAFDGSAGIKLTLDPEAVAKGKTVNIRGTVSPAYYSGQKCYIYVGDGDGNYDQVLSSENLSSCSYSWTANTDVMGWHTVQLIVQPTSVSMPAHITAAEVAGGALSGYEPKVSEVINVCESGSCTAVPSINITVSPRSGYLPTGAAPGTEFKTTVYIPNLEDSALVGKQCYFYVSSNGTFFQQGAKSLSDCASEGFTWTPNASTDTTVSHELRVSIQAPSGTPDANSAPYAYQMIRVCQPGAATCDAPNVPGGTNDGPGETPTDPSGNPWKGSFEKGSLWLLKDSVTARVGGREITIDLRDPDTGDIIFSNFLLAIVFKWMSWFLAIFCFVGYVVGGIQFLSSAGDKAKAEKGKKTLIYTTIAVVLGTLGYVIIVAIVRALNTFSLN